jgi:Flp pilus assembly protein CpaB
MGDYRIIVVAALATSAIVADALAARQAASASAAVRQQTASPPKIEVKSILVSEPVTVRDSKGMMIHDLQVEDFRLTDNGVPQKITDFEVSTHMEGRFRRKSH